MLHAAVEHAAHDSRADDDHDACAAARAGSPAGRRVRRRADHADRNDLDPEDRSEHPIYEGVWLTVLDHGPGHWPNSACPGSGAMRCSPVTA